MGKTMEYFNGNQAAENASYEANAPYDYIREANTGMDDPVAGTEEYSAEYEAELYAALGLPYSEGFDAVVVATDDDGDIPW